MMTPSTSHSLLRYVRSLVASEADTLAADVELLQRFIRERDEAAFAALVRRHGPLVFGVAQRVLGRAAEVEDVFQTTFWTLARRANAIRNREALGSWLYGVAYRLARKAKARASRANACPAILPQCDPPDPLASAAFQETLAILDEELTRLPDKYRDPLVHCYLEEKTHDEAARQMGCPLGTLRSRLDRAKELLRERLARRGILFSTAILTVALTRTTARAALPDRLVTSTVAVATQAGAAGTLSVLLLGKLRLATLILVFLTALAAGIGWSMNQSPPEGTVEEPADPSPRAVEAVLPRQDQFGDPLPPAALARLGTTRLKTSYRTFALAFSPDGRRLAGGGSDADPLIRIWDAATGRQQLGIAAGWPNANPLANMGNGIMALAYSSDGQRLAGAGFGLNRVGLWDAQSGKLLQWFTGYQQGVTSVAFSPDGKTLASGSYDKTVRLWDVTTGQALRPPITLPGVVYRVAFTPDGTQLLSAGEDKVIRIWEVRTGKELRRLEGHQGSVFAAAISGDGKLLASGSADRTVRLWDLTTSQERLCLRGHGKDVTCLAWAPDGKQLFTGCRDQVVRCWDTATGKLIRRTPNLGLDVSSLALSPDDRRLAVSGYEQGAVILDTTTLKETLPGAGHKGSLLCVHFTPDGQRLVTGSTDGTLRLWEPQTGKELATLLNEPDGWFIGFALSPDGRTLADSGYGNVCRLREFPTGKVLFDLKESDGHIPEVHFAPDGQTVATVCFAGSARKHELTFWDVKTGKKRWTFAGRALAFAPDGKTVAVGGTDLTLREVPTGKLIRQVLPNADLQSIAFTPDSQALLLTDGPGTMTVWDLERARARRHVRYRDHDPISRFNSLALSPDGRLAATILSGHVFKVWEVATLQPLGTFEGHQGDISRLEFSPDGRTLVSASYDGTALVWDVLQLVAGTHATNIVLEPDQLAGLWRDLSGTEAARAYRAVGRLVRSPQQAVPYVREQLRPIKAADEKKIERWIADLDHDNFAVRQQANADLEQIGGVAEEALRRALAAQPTLEARRRLERLLERIEHGDGGATSRALAVLEYAATPEARRLLQDLAAGAPGARLTVEARAALERLAKQR